MSSRGRISAALSDHYCVDLDLGQGGIAAVYLVEHDRKVAIMVLRPELAARVRTTPALPAIGRTAPCTC